MQAPSSAGIGPVSAVGPTEIERTEFEKACPILWGSGPCKGVSSTEIEGGQKGQVPEMWRDRSVECVGSSEVENVKVGKLAQLGGYRADQELAFV